jgi:hypothetical protein
MSAQASAQAALFRSRRALHALLSMMLALLALAASASAWADPPGRVGRIGDTDGAVWLYDDEQGEWIQARRNRPVTEGDRISAEQGARAEIDIGSATLRLEGATDVEFTQLDDARVRIRLHGGSVALRVRGADSVRDFSVITAEGIYEPLRAGHYRVDVRDSSSLGETLAGAMRFEANDSVLELNDGQRAEFWQDNGVTHYAWATASNDSFGDWVAREDRRDNRDRNRYVSPEMTGAEDLDRYGQWDRHPEYGAVWYPTTVVAGWAPYRYGHWAHLSPWGWTWVDDAPWGFAPFHYGRWVNYGGRWGWCPGQYVARPVFAPALVAWFGGPNVRVGINIGGPAVGWVPLAPREIYYPTYNVTNVYVRNVNVTHRRWQGPNPRYERAVPTGPIMYTNQGVAGGVTVVPQGVMQGRQPVGNRVVPVDARTVTNWRGQSGVQARGVVPVAPTRPPARVVAAPGGAVAAVPAPPGAVRTAPWGQGGARVGAAQGDGGQARRGINQPDRDQRPGAANGRAPMAPSAQPGIPPQQRGGDAQQRTRPQREQRGERSERRVAAPTAVPQVAPNTSVQPAPPKVREPAPAPPQDRRGVPQVQGQAAPGQRAARDRVQVEERDAQRGPDDRARRVRDPREQQVR